MDDPNQALWEQRDAERSAMSDINRIIAEWMGWRDFKRTSRRGNPHPEGAEIWAIDPSSYHGGCYERCRIPSYTSDLNACAAAERKLDSYQRRKHAEILWFQLETEGGDVWDDRAAFLSATAPQRAAALAAVITQSKCPR